MIKRGLEVLFFGGSVPIGILLIYFFPILFSARTQKEFNQSISIIMMLLLLLGIILVLFMFRTSFHEPLQKDRVKGLVGKKVYSLDGEYVGLLKEVIISKNHIYGIRVDMNGKKGKIKKKTILGKDISRYGDIVFVDSRLLENIKSE